MVNKWHTREQLHRSLVSSFITTESTFSQLIWGPTLTSDLKSSSHFIFKHSLQLTSVPYFTRDYFYLTFVNMSFISAYNWMNALFKQCLMFIVWYLGVRIETIVKLFKCIFHKHGYFEKLVRRKQIWTINEIWWLPQITLAVEDKIFKIEKVIPLSNDFRLKGKLRFLPR